MGVARMRGKCNGFTLVELLVVVRIIGILAAVAVPQYTMVVEKARLSEALTVMSSLEKAIDVWLLEHGTPTDDISFLGDNANGKGQLDIDLESGMDCSIDEGSECGNKNFSYFAKCVNNGVCYIRSLRMINGDRDAVPYTVDRLKPSPTSPWQGDECSYLYEDTPTPYAEKICKMLEAQGGGYYACDNC